MQRVGALADRTDGRVCVVNQASQYRRHEAAKYSTYRLRWHLGCLLTRHWDDRLSFSDRRIRDVQHVLPHCEKTLRRRYDILIRDKPLRLNSW